MYFWKVDKLKADLRERSLSESETFKYLFASQVMYGLMMIPFLENNVWDVYLAIVTSLITLVGVFYVYKCNNGAIGNNFLQRYVSLGWVVGIRYVALFMFPITVVFYTVIGIYSSLPEHTTLFEVIFFSAIHTVFYLLLGKHIKELSKA